MVLSLNKRGLRSLREIAIEVNCSHETVRRIGNHFINHGTVEPIKRQPKRKTTEDEDNIIIGSAIVFNDFSVIKLMEKVREVIDLKISRRTFNDRLIGNIKSVKH